MSVCLSVCSLALNSYLKKSTSKLSHAEFRVLWNIIESLGLDKIGHNLNYPFFVSQTNIAESIEHLNVRTVQRVESRLIELGWFEKKIERSKNKWSSKRILTFTKERKKEIVAYAKSLKEKYVKPKKPNNKRARPEVVSTPDMRPHDIIQTSKEYKTKHGGGCSSVVNTRSDMNPLPKTPPPSKKVSSQVVAAARILETLLGWKKHDFRAFNSDVEAFIVDRGSDGMGEFQKWISGQPRAFGKKYTPEKWQDLIDRFDGKCQDDEVVDIEVSDEILAEMNERQQLQNQRTANGVW